VLLAAEGLVEPVEDLGDRGPGLAQDVVSVARGLERVGASVGGVALAFDEPGRLEPVDGLDDRGAGEPELIGECLLEATRFDRGERPVQGQQMCPAAPDGRIPSINDWRGGLAVAAYAPLVLWGRCWQRSPPPTTSGADKRPQRSGARHGQAQ
jgi:hypothetical protein